MNQNASNYRVIIVDDESLARLNLRSLIEKDSELELIAECKNGYEAITAINEMLPDLVFLDIQMPEINGFQVLEKIDLTKTPAIIFVTAYDQYAIRAFEVNALDYLLKPLEEARFEKAVRQAKGILKNKDLSFLTERLISLLQTPDTDAGSSNYLDRIVIKSIGKVMFLAVSEIEWIEADDYYVKIHTPERSHLVRQSLSDLEKNLNPREFQRIHRSYIVNLAQIKEIQSDFQNKSVVILKNGKRLKMSRPKQEIIDKMVGL